MSQCKQRLHGWTLAMAAVLALVPQGCRDESPAVAAAKEYASAVRSRDVERLLQYVDAKTVQYADSLAARASDQIGGRRSVDATEMLQVVDAEQRAPIVRAELVEETLDTATVRLVATDDSEQLLSLTQEDGAWKVVLPASSRPLSSHE